MWPFDRLSPATRRFLAALTIAAQLVIGLKVANAESKKTDKCWNEVAVAEQNYKSEGSEQNLLILKDSLKNLIDSIENDLKLVKDKEQSVKMQQELDNLKKIYNSLPVAKEKKAEKKLSERKFRKEIVVVVSNEAQKMAHDENYEIKGPLVYIGKNKKPQLLLTENERKKVHEEIWKIDIEQLRKNAAEAMMLSIIARENRAK